MTQMLLARSIALPKFSPSNVVSVKNNDVLDILDRVAALDVEVLITGPSSVGKELCAHYLHQRSQRADCAFVQLNCAKTPKDLIETALFGHGGGAFTSARVQGAGLIAEAEGGVMFLDEVAQLPLGMQVKLLRLLQEKEYRPLGGTRIQRANVRIIAATSAETARGLGEKPFFRELLSRLRLNMVEFPVLADGREEILFFSNLSQPTHEDPLCPAQCSE
ncbi:Anaerobic nitric oxide reductase transcription regulator NorR [Paraburkholderia ultramafica]|uniref:Anaerobic nitric oxide reductase transcription regulator NorR n=1 Tax=Paraburkholderia ultramafica TaxID=1544867 RepID=A0A6S7B3X3_9BURK|nr:sigma-54 factor interaction domain-containing protein [Paraburkholderia ultramafica]CAB3778792.1 Anaerobic nitric oxide reductase transcription regulator NorR [Paraburkholderia ultramafica]